MDGSRSSRTARMSVDQSRAEVSQASLSAEVIGALRAALAAGSEASFDVATLQSARKRLASLHVRSASLGCGTKREAAAREAGSAAPGAPSAAPEPRPSRDSALPELEGSLLLLLAESAASAQPSKKDHVWSDN